MSRQGRYPLKKVQPVLRERFPEGPAVFTFVKDPSGKWRKLLIASDAQRLPEDRVLTQAAIHRGKGGEQNSIGSVEILTKIHFPGL